MTDHDPNLAERIDIARTRSNELASRATNRTREFVAEHPVATIAGGIAIGALIAGLLWQRGRSTAKHPATDAAAARLGRLAALGADLALAYAARAASAGKDGVETVAERGAEAGRKASDLAEITPASLREGAAAAIHRLRG